MRFLVINGPNLNMLGEREPRVYGTRTLADINGEIEKFANDNGVRVDFFQSNSEGEIIDKIQSAHTDSNGIVLNAGAYTHYSYAIRDAIAATAVPTVEVHLSNIYSREEFRSKSVIAPVCLGQISGLGEMGYAFALAALVEVAKHES